MDINDMRREREQRAGKARELLTVVETASRAMTTEEVQTFDRLMDEADAFDATIQRAEKAREQQRKEAEIRERVEGTTDSDDSPEERAFRQYLTGGRASVEPALQRALTAGSDPEGGYLVVPQKFAEGLIQAVDDAVPMRQYATTMTLTEAASLGAISLDTDFNDADWTTELATGSLDESIRFGKRELTPHPVAKRTKLSRTLLRLSGGKAEDIVSERLAYKFAVTQEKAFMTGNGVNKPLGLFTASAQGINTDRDVDVYDDSDNAYVANLLIDAKYTLKAAYWPKAQWLFHRDSIKEIRKLRDDTGGAGVGNFLWQPGLAGGAPDTILDSPYIVSEWVPNTFTSGNYVGMYADLSFYWIVDSLDMEVQRLVELYAETNQVGFIGRMESDGMPVLSEAFVRLKVRA